MSELNIPVLIGLLLRIVSVAFIGFYIGSKAALELRRPKDGLTKLRWILLTTIFSTVIIAVPSITYQITRLHQPSVNTLQAIASISGNLSYFVLAVSLGLIYSYNREDK